jgi:hypothetical protein
MLDIVLKDSTFWNSDIIAVYTASLSSLHSKESSSESIVIVGVP